MEIMAIDFEKLKGAVWGKQPKIAAKLGVHVNTLNRKINQRGRLYLEDLNKIAVALGRNTSEFITEVEISNAKEILDK